MCIDDLITPSADNDITLCLTFRPGQTVKRTWETGDTPGRGKTFRDGPLNQREEALRYRED